MYRNGDEVVYKNQVCRIILHSRGSILLSDFSDDWHVADESEVYPYSIQNNKEGKHLLERLEE